jgi:hypothetical protein
MKVIPEIMIINLRSEEGWGGGGKRGGGGLRGGTFSGIHSKKANGPLDQKDVLQVNSEKHLPQSPLQVNIFK